jgi:hypothetical protein
MSVKSINLESLIDWLGAEGAVAGLDRGHHTNAELMIIARNNGIIVDSKTARRQIAIEIIMSRIQRIDRNDDELLEMSKDELVRYFTDRMVSRSEIKSLLDKLQISPRGKVRSKFVDFASNEISDLGMYQRVAKGHGRAA